MSDGNALNLGAIVQVIGVSLSLVVDTSVVISVITNEEHKPRLIKVTEGEELVAPSSIHWEIGNAFSAMFRRKRIELKQVRKALEQYRMIPMRLIEVDLESSLRIAEQYGLYAYDAYFLECAMKLKLPLLTLDRVLVDAAKQIGVDVKEI